MELHRDDGPERALLRRTVAQLAEGFGHAYFADRAREGRFPEELWSALRAAGLTAVNVPAEHGGGGGGLVDLVVVAEELAAAGCPLMTLVVSPALCAPVLQAFGTPEQKQRWLTAIGDGSERMSFALTEAAAGTNSYAITTTARRSGDGWTLSGEKHYISGVDDAGAVMVVARTGTHEDGRAALSLFIVDPRQRGVSLSPIRTVVQAAERQFLLTFDDVELPQAALVGTEGAGMRQLFVGLNPERILSAATCLGIARYALDRATAYALDRAVWGRPIGTHQGVAHPLARAFVGLSTAVLATYQAADAFDAGGDAGTAASVAKFHAAQAANAAVGLDRGVHGGHGLSEEYGIADLWGLARLYRIAPVSDEMALSHIAQHALGLPRSY
jgi:alkylation response protein AidB-like acyl-CoA dehydrogenase